MAHWADSALCAQTDPDLWFPAKGESSVHAKRICMRCPVRQECREDVLTRVEEFGVWAGMVYDERHALRQDEVAA
jgi:WhiB family redox-sensing transcriptional regulator